MRFKQKKPDIFVDISLNTFLLSFLGHVGGTYQVRIGPVAFEGSRHLGDNEVIHLLSGFWMISEAGKHGRKHLPLTITDSAKSHALLLK